MKQTGLLYIAWSAMLVLFAGCSDDDDGGVKSLAQLEAKTVNSITKTDRLITQGPKGQSFQAKIMLAEGEEWCSFDPASQLATAGRRCGGRGAASLLAGKPLRRIPRGGYSRHLFRRLFRDPAAVADALFRNSGVRPGMG